ncbi:MAG: DUF2115 domain-containing protein [Methanocalculaceae archaeon]|jgi:uncharacterized protein (UPF0305 family)|nr:DUF2115 domain-containing protein [Methanocalculaceae archaeon]
MGFWNRSGAERSAAGGTDWYALERFSRKGELLAELKSCGSLFTPEDLEEMLARYSKKLVHVRKEYAATLLASARVQVVDGYHRMMIAELAAVHADVRLPVSWKEFVRFAAVQTHGKRLAELKYLIAAYAMYIAEEPAHPVGTPFPGGYTVELHEGVYYCPVRAAQGEVDEALCRFCPAVQSRERDLVLTRGQREFVERGEKLENYFYNYHG